MFGLTGDTKYRRLVGTCIGAPNSIMFTCNKTVSRVIPISLM